MTLQEFNTFCKGFKYFNEYVARLPTSDYAIRHLDKMRIYARENQITIQTKDFGYPEKIGLKFILSHVTSDEGNAFYSFVL
jgi:hypothetical protein